MNSKAEISYILILLTIFSSVSAFTFEDSKQEGVTFGDVSSNGAQQIYIDENNEKAEKKLQVQAVFINDVQLDPSKSEPTVNVLAGDASLLNHKIIDLGGQKFAFAVNVLDYEALPELSKRFLIQISDSKDKKNLVIFINNLDDEKPTLTTSSCTIKENTTITLDNTNCSFTIEDPDGFLDKMDFSDIIDAGKNESKLFQLEYKDPITSDDTKSATVYLTLKDGQILDYETVTLYTFHVAIKDGGMNPTVPENVLIIVEVDDIPDMPPVWTTFTSAKRIPEESPNSIQVSAKDGDYGLNKDINYKIVTNGDAGKFLDIDVKTGLIAIKSIDRDKGYDSIEFDVVAYEAADENSLIQSSITLMIDDIDDNKPLIHITDSTETELKLNVTEGSDSIAVDLYVEDLDQGENAMYNVKLVSSGNVDYGSAFQIVPSKGYEKTTLSLTVTDSSKLDYENDDWKVIKFSIQTTGTKNEKFTDTLPVTITLEDINDEKPEFDDSELTVTVPENLKKGEVVASVKATDKDAIDIEKGVKHEIVGTMKKYLSIEEFGGEIKTLEDNVFNYEKQTEVYVQILATDNGGNTVTAQLTIHVTDVNDETPRLIVTSGISVDENQKDKTPLTTDIKATDDDLTPDLQFSIDWANSYATKNAQRLKDDDFAKIHCINAEADKDTGDIHTVKAKLSIIETQKNNTPDHEIFDTLFIMLVVTDTNQTEGVNSDSAIIVINIVNLNDNKPVFLDDTTTKERQVTENAAKNTLIDVITATDADQLGKLNYSISNTDQDTSDWIIIDRESGSLLVNVDTIDCDDPQRQAIDYTVTATDGEYFTSVDITIKIRDENDNSPTLTGETKSISEDDALSNQTQNGDVVFTLEPTDIDRDLPYHTVQCTFQQGTTSDVISRFQIVDNTIIVNLTNGATLDREDKPSFQFDLACTDNPGGLKSNPVSPPPKFVVNLDDVNDNKPVITFKNIITNVHENTALGPLSANITAEDKDEGVNGEISFSITKIQRYIDEDCTTLMGDDDTDLFTISTDDVSKKNAILSVAKSLKDHYECLKLTVTATDGGGLKTEDNEIKVAVRKFNFKEPVFNFPKDGGTLYLDFTQSVGNPLRQYNGEVLDHLSASDQQGGKYDIKFKVVSDGTDNNDLFVVSNNDLQITDSGFNSKVDYSVTIMAYLDVKTDPVEGEASYNANSTVTIKFFSSNTDPQFSSNVIADGVTTTFKENDKNATYVLPVNATYPDISLPDLEVYYLLQQGDADIFIVDILTGTITLNVFLDYEAHSDPYSLVIVASNSKSLKPKPPEASKLKVKIIVEDQNDEPPIFESDKYYATIIAGSQSNAPVTKVVAHDKDTIDELNYSITEIEASDSSTTDHKFNITKDGQITSEFVVTDDMKGVYYTLTINVTDTDELHSDTTTVIVYIVTTINTVNFKFSNPLDVVRSKMDQIKQIVDGQFKYESQVEQPKSDSSESDGTITIAPIYFINSTENKPLEGTVILRQVTDVSKFNSLKTDFSNVGLQLLNFQTETGADENLQEILKAWLIGVSVVLGALCIVLLVAFILKTRALKQRIKNLSNTKFGSQESGLNRTGISAPTTNKHAVEGSNPVYNETTTKNIDALSVTSGDSDLIGVEDDEKFDYEYPEKEEKF